MAATSEEALEGVPSTWLREGVSFSRAFSGNCGVTFDRLLKFKLGKNNFSTRNVSQDSLGAAKEIYQCGQVCGEQHLRTTFALNIACCGGIDQLYAVRQVQHIFFCLLYRLGRLRATVKPPTNRYAQLQLLDVADVVSS